MKGQVCGLEARRGSWEEGAGGFSGQLERCLHCSRCSSLMGPAAPAHGDAMPQSGGGKKYMETYCTIWCRLLHLSFSISSVSSQPLYPVYSYNSFLCEIGNGTKSITLFSNSKPLWDSNSDTGCSSGNSQSPT